MPLLRSVNLPVTVIYVQVCPSNKEPLKSQLLALVVGIKIRVLFIVAIQGSRLKDILSKCTSTLNTAVQRQSDELWPPSLNFHPGVTYHFISHFLEKKQVTFPHPISKRIGKLNPTLAQTTKSLKYLVNSTQVYCSNQRSQECKTQRVCHQHSQKPPQIKIQEAISHQKGQG